MPKSLSYEVVNEFFEKNGCILKTKKYINNKQKLEYIGVCGHTKFGSFDVIKRLKHLGCKSCIIKSASISRQMRIENKLLSKRIKTMECKLSNSLKYRDDFSPERYDQTIACSTCKRIKPIRLFSNGSNYKNGKRKICKKCNNCDHKKRRKNYTIDQQMSKLLKTCEQSSKKRSKLGRDNMVFDINIDDVMNLKNKQNNKCKYSGRELVWKINVKNKASIDRIDSNKGYTKDNIQLVCFEVNQAKK